MGSSCLIPTKCVGNEYSNSLASVNAGSGEVQAFIGPVAVIRPPSSTLNTVIHVSMANGFDVKLSSSTNGRVAIVWDGYAGSRSHVILDVTGYLR